MAHDHTIYDSDHHYSINPITRAITNSSASAKLILMQHDHNSERFSFDIPREIEGHDLSNCNRIEVHYTNTDATKRNVNVGVYEVTDLAINKSYPSMLTFSWLVSENATMYAGTLSFIITFSCVENGICTYRWNTGINNSISIAKGMSNGEAMAELYPDILGQWKDELFAAVYGFKSVHIGPTPPDAYPYLWFNTSEDNAGNGIGQIVIRDSNGDLHDLYPIVKMDSVESLDEELKTRMKNYSPTPAELGAADIEHKHEISDVKDLQDTLTSLEDNKAPSDHNHEISGVNGLEDALNDKAPSAHGHDQTEITGLDGVPREISRTLHTITPEMWVQKEDGSGYEFVISDENIRIDTDVDVNYPNVFKGMFPIVYNNPEIDGQITATSDTAMDEAFSIWVTISERLERSE